MTKRRKWLTWLGLFLSLLAASYAGVSFIFYSWLSAAEPEHWPPERASVWAFGAFALAILFFGLFVYCLVSLIRETNRRYREEQKAK
jgi:O-antigen/teichoic acid export membrane protein